MGKFLTENLRVFTGRTSDADSTLMPASRAWMREMVDDIGETAVVLFMNCPAVGILGASFKSFMLTYITNCLADFPKNAICFLVHPNRAGQQEGRTFCEKINAFSTFVLFEKNLAKSFFLSFLRYKI